MSDLGSDAAAVQVGETATPRIITENIGNLNDRKDKTGVQKLLVSLVIIGLVAITWTGGTQFSKSSLSNSTAFNAPYFLVWFTTNWMIVSYPIYACLSGMAFACFPQKLNHVISPRHAFREASLVFGSSGLTLKAVLKRTIPFTILWILANYSYSRALAYISASETTTAFSTNLAFVYLLSWIFLGDALVILRILAILLATAGIVLMMQGSGYANITVVGVICAVASAFVAAIYKVFFKKIIGNAGFGQVSLFMSALGLCNLLGSWPVALTLLLTSAETVAWNLVPWPYICASAILSLLFNLSVNFGIAFTHPVFVSLGMFLGLPLNAAMDAICRKQTLHDLEIVGAVCIVTSFLILLLPEDFAPSLLRKLRRQSNRI